MVTEMCKGFLALLHVYGNTSTRRYVPWELPLCKEVEMDTQLIRNAYLMRDNSELALPFGEFACRYLNVLDDTLFHISSINEACNYILAKGYNK